MTAHLGLHIDTLALPVTIKRVRAVEIADLHETQSAGGARVKVTIVLQDLTVEGDSHATLTKHVGIMSVAESGSSVLAKLKPGTEVRCFMHPDGTAQPIDVVSLDSIQTIDAIGQAQAMDRLSETELLAQASSYEYEISELQRRICLATNRSTSQRQIVPQDTSAPGSGNTMVDVPKSDIHAEKKVSRKRSTAKTISGSRTLSSGRSSTRTIVQPRRRGRPPIQPSAEIMQRVLDGMLALQAAAEMAANTKPK
jgi:hypothetical protein